MQQILLITAITLRLNLDPFVRIFNPEYQSDHEIWPELPPIISSRELRFPLKRPIATLIENQTFPDQMRKNLVLSTFFRLQPHLRRTPMTNTFNLIGDKNSDRLHLDPSAEIEAARGNSDKYVFHDKKLK